MYSGSIDQIQTLPVYGMVVLYSSSFIGAVEFASVALLVQQFRELLNMHKTIDLLSSVL